MRTLTTRRAAIGTVAAGVSGMAMTSLPPARTTLAAISSGAGVAAGGSLEGPNGTIQFSAFGSRIEIEGESELTMHGALAWYDPAGVDGQPLTIALVIVESYGPVGDDLPNARRLTGTVSVNGEGEYPFELQLEDTGAIGTTTDTVHLTIQDAVDDQTGTPIPAAEVFSYDVQGDLTSGDVQLISFV